jgi:hypothetical protein
MRVRGLLDCELGGIHAPMPLEFSASGTSKFDHSDRYTRRDQETELDGEDGYRILPHEKVLTVHVAATSLAREALLTDAHLQPEAITRTDWLQQLDAQVIAAKEGLFHVRGADDGVD